MKQSLSGLSSRGIVTSQGRL
ncbi:hypothetical protein LINPERHAP1_LOCUS13976 [Linum perenne]